MENLKLQRIKYLQELKHAKTKRNFKNKIKIIVSPIIYYIKNNKNDYDVHTIDVIYTIIHRLKTSQIE